MQNITLENFYIEEIVFKNNIGEEGKQLQLQFSDNHKVSVDDENKVCESTYCFNVSTEGDEEALSINLVLKSVHLCDDASKEVKDDIVNGILDIIFPYVRSIVTNLTVMSSLPPLIIPNPLP